MPMCYEEGNGYECWRRDLSSKQDAPSYLPPLLPAPSILPHCCRSTAIALILEDLKSVSYSFGISQLVSSVGV